LSDYDLSRPWSDEPLSRSNEDTTSLKATCDSPFSYWKYNSQKSFKGHIESSSGPGISLHGAFSHTPSCVRAYSPTLWQQHLTLTCV
jgi:hypothetical protein